MLAPRPPHHLTSVLDLGARQTDELPFYIPLEKIGLHTTGVDGSCGARDAFLRGGFHNYPRLS